MDHSAGLGEARIRPIARHDDDAIASVIRTVMPEYGASGPGFAISDPEVDFMSRAYAGAGCAYFVVELEGRVVGGGGVAPLAGGDPDTCELRKMYFLPALRGRGMGRRLLELCIETARALGYRRMYLETLTGMDAAQALYRKVGFRRIEGAKGATGHHGCDRFYERELGPRPRSRSPSRGHPARPSRDDLQSAGTTPAHWSLHAALHSMSL